MPSGWILVALRYHNSRESSTFEQVTNHVAGLPAYDGKPWTCSPAKAIDDVN